MLAERNLLDWIPVKSRLCAVWLNVRSNNSRLKHCFSSYLCMHPLNTFPTKDEFYQELSPLLRSAHSIDAVAVGDFHGLLGYLEQAGQHIGARFSCPAD